MYPDSEKRGEILLPHTRIEGRLVGLQALRNANNFWLYETSYQATCGIDDDYGDRWGAVGLRLAKMHLDIGMPQEVQKMLNRFVDDGSRDHARDRTLLLFGNHKLYSEGVVSAADYFSMITSPRLRDHLLGSSIVHTAITNYGQEEINSIAKMIVLHMEGLKSPRWGGNEQEKRIPHYDWHKGEDRPLLSPLIIDIPQTNKDLDRIYESAINSGKGLSRLEIMTSLAEILIKRFQATDNEVIAQIQIELDSYTQQNDLEKEMIKLLQDDIPEGSVYSWMDTIEETRKLQRLGLIASSGRQQGQKEVNELLKGEKIWKVISQERTLIDVLGSILQSYAAGTEINPQVIVQGLAAYGVGSDEKNRKVISRILLKSIPQATMRQDQWSATAGRLIGYLEAVSLFDKYDRDYLDVDLVGDKLLNVRLANLHNLSSAIDKLVPDEKNQALLSFYRLGPERVRAIVNHNFDWSHPDRIKILSQLEDLPIESIGAFLQYYSRN